MKLLGKKGMTIRGFIIGLLVFAMLVVGFSTLLSSTNDAGEYQNMNATFLTKYNISDDLTRQTDNMLSETNSSTMLAPIAFFTQGSWSVLKLAFNFPSLIKNLLIGTFNEEGIKDWGIDKTIITLLMGIIIVIFVFVVVSWIGRYPI